MPESPRTSQRPAAPAAPAAPRRAPGAYDRRGSRGSTHAWPVAADSRAGRIDFSLSPPPPGCSGAARPWPRAFMLADAVMGLAIVALLAASMAVVLNRQAHGTRRLADERAATWAAELALAQLRAGRPAAEVAPAGAGAAGAAGATAEAGADADAVAGTGTESIEVEPAAGGAAPAGYEWVRVRAGVNGRRAALVGLVPAIAAAAAAPGGPVGGRDPDGNAGGKGAGGGGDAGGVR